MTGIERLVNTDILDILRLGAKTEGIYAPTYTSPTQLITHYSQLFYFFIFLILVITSIIYLLVGRVKENDKKWVILIIVWLLGLGFAGAAFPVRETIYRLYIFGLIPVILIILKALPFRTVLIVLMAFSVLFTLPARYGTEGYHGQMTSSELVGMRFFSYRTNWPGNCYFFYNQGDTVLRLYYNSDVLHWTYVGSTDVRQLPSGELINIANRVEKPLVLILDEARYVLTGRQGAIQEALRFGQEVIISSWTQTGDGAIADLIYNNGNFQIYKRYEPYK
ncbi:hypothetical protein ACFLUO_08910 [Chloroflexota bacterium]